VSFSRRIAFLSGLAVAVAILLASVAAYVLVGRTLESQLDRSLGARGGQLLGRGDQLAQRIARLKPEALRNTPAYDYTVQIVRPDGRAETILAPALPVDARTRAVAAGHAGAYTATAGDIRMRVTPLANGGGALQIGRSLDDLHAVMSRVRLILILVACGGVALAALLGRLVAGRAIAPLRGLARTAERVAETRDLGHRIEVVSDDEIGRLAVRFNAMLDVVEAAMRSQRQLIADASHELRTPVTSLRTNLEILQANPDLPPERRAALIDRAEAQSRELTALMNDVIQLARWRRPASEREPVRLDELVEEALARASRHAPAQRFDADLDETTVSAAPAQLARAVNNLLDNAARWNAPGAPIELTLRDGELTVRDHGPGFDAAELDHVFDRFFRGAGARGRSGSGLGLAIARQVAEAHGGTIEARNAPGGGALLALRLPQTSP
jgi:two-component system sensor histidine kinase MprB